MALVALFDKLSGSHASAQFSVFNDCSVCGKRQIAGIPRSKASEAAFKSRSMLLLLTPGIEGILFNIIAVTDKNGPYEIICINARFTY